MENIVQAVFNSATDAHQAQKALERLADDNMISIGETYILRRDSDGGPAVIASSTGEDIGTRTMGGGLVGGLIGLLGGPVGVAVGASLGAVAGGTGDAIKADDVHNYLHEAAKRLPADKSMLIADVWEVDFKPVNAIMTQFQAPFSRIDVSLELELADQQELDAIDRDIAQAQLALQNSVDTDKAAWQNKVAQMRLNRNQQQQERTEQRIAKQQARLSNLRVERQRI